MASPEEWFADLTQRGANRIGVRWVAGNEKSAPDRMLAAFAGGGGTWIIQVQNSDGSYEQWVSQWDVDESRIKVDGRIWRVDYRRAYSGKESIQVTPAIEALGDLKHALTEVHAYASRNDAKSFTGRFAKAMMALDCELDSAGYHRDLSPVPLPDASAALLNAAQHAWVFGGMGSWNDICFDGEESNAYEQVSEQLYQALIRAIPAAVEFASRDD